MKRKPYLIDIFLSHSFLLFFFNLMFIFILLFANVFENLFLKISKIITCNYESGFFGGEKIFGNQIKYRSELFLNENFVCCTFKIFKWNWFIWLILFANCSVYLISNIVVKRRMTNKTQLGIKGIYLIARFNSYCLFSIGLARIYRNIHLHVSLNMRIENRICRIGRWNVKLLCLKYSPWRKPLKCWRFIQNVVIRGTTGITRKYIIIV